jgi:hypothetical protein
MRRMTPEQVDRVTRDIGNADSNIGHLDDVVPVDEKAARPAELRLLTDEITLLGEDPDAIFVAVANEQLPERIHGQREGNVDLACSRPFPPPSLDERAVLGELHDARVGFPAMPVSDEDVAVRRGHERGEGIEFARAMRANDGCACDPPIVQECRSGSGQSDSGHLAICGISGPWLVDARN